MPDLSESPPISRLARAHPAFAPGFARLDWGVPHHFAPPAGPRLAHPAHLAHRCAPFPVYPVPVFDTFPPRAHIFVAGEGS
jgi:hypothetical protein